MLEITKRVIQEPTNDGGVITRTEWLLEGYPLCFLSGADAWSFTAKNITLTLVDPSFIPPERFCNKPPRIEIVSSNGYWIDDVIRYSGLVEPKRLLEECEYEIEQFTIEPIPEVLSILALTRPVLHPDTGKEFCKEVISLKYYFDNKVKPE